MTYHGPMNLIHDLEGPIVLIGGTGVVGRNVAPLLARALPDRALVIGGRNPAGAQATLEAVRRAGGRAHFEHIALGTQSDRTHRAALVLVLVNDPADEVLQAALKSGVPCVDVTRWTTRMTAAVGRVASTASQAPVVLSSSWMGGLLPRVVAHLAADLGDDIEVDGSVRYAMADASGPDSVDYLDRTWVPFEVIEAGRPRLVEAFRDVDTVVIDGHSTLVGRFDTPEQWTLPLTLGVRRAAVRIGFDSVGTTRALFLLVRLGFFWALRSESCRGVRRALLRQEGSEAREGARASFRVDVRGSRGRRSMTLVSDHGQAALTAAGAVLAVRQALALGCQGGVFFPELDPANLKLPTLLSELGVHVATERDENVALNARALNAAAVGAQA
jgi:saccharopine dehydrogenase-like NADP-dependent oxidoreductase